MREGLLLNELKVLFNVSKVFKIKTFHTLHQMFGHINGVLNVKKKN